MSSHKLRSMDYNITHPNEDYIEVGQNVFSYHPGWSIQQEFFDNCKADRQFTEGFIYAGLRAKYRSHHITVVPGYSADFLAFANATDGVSYSPHKDQGLVERSFAPPLRRYNDENGGTFVDRVVFGCYEFQFKSNKFIICIADCQDGMYKTRYNYVLFEYKNKEEKAYAQKTSDELIAEATKYMQELHNEVLVFDQGYWQKNKDLWENIQKSNWEDVILEHDRKEAIIEDVIGFFDAESRYAEFGVPWKRGVIFYGPPGVSLFLSPIHSRRRIFALTLSKI